MKKYKLRRILFMHKGWLFLVVLLTVLGALFELLKAYIMQWVFDALTAENMRQLQLVFVIALLYVAGSIVEQQLQYWAYNKYIQVSMYSLKENWFSSISKKGLGEYQAEKESEYIAHFTADAENIRSSYFDNFLTMLNMLLTGIAAAISILTIHYVFLVVVLLTFWIPTAINKAWQKRISRSKQSVSDENGKFVALVSEQLRGFETNKLFGITNHMTSLFQKQNADVEYAYYKNSMAENTAVVGSGMASVGIWLLNMLAGAFCVINGILTIGRMMNAMQLLNNVINPLYQISAYWVQMKAADELYENISCQLEDNTQEIIVSENKQQKLMGIDHGISLKNVGLEWMGREVIKNADVYFEKNKKYLIRGESGSGKSSVIKILLGGYQNYTGKVQIDDTDLRSIRQEDWYQKIAVVSQDNFVFADTVLHNITMYQGYSAEEIRQAAELSALTDFISQHPEGLEFQIEENGKNISGGEKQRICLARALIRKTPILILDEATSALDSGTARLVEKNILNLKNTTVLFVSHRTADDLISGYDGVMEVKDHQISMYA